MNVQLVSKTQGIGKYSELNSEELISAIARHGIIKEDNGKLVKYLMDNSHWSPLDMINFTFEIETSRAIGRQILRHSSIKFQEHSQRYSNRVLFESIELRYEDKINRQSSTEIFKDHIEAIKYIEDWTLQEYSGNAKSLIDSYLTTADNFYNALLKVGIAKECARMILPECTTTTLSANGTLRSWLSFLNVRLDEHAQKEIRIIANLIADELVKELPNVFSSIDWKNGMFM